MRRNVVETKRRTRIWVACGTSVAVLAMAGGTVAYLRQASPMRRAERLEAAGDIRGAVVEWRNAVRDRPRDGEAHLRLGTAQLRMADAVAAEREFRLARTTGADRDTALGKLGEALVAEGRYAPLLHELPEAGSTPEATAKLLLLRCIAQLATGDDVAAQATQTLAETKVPAQIETTLIKARVSLASGHPAEAEAQVDAALRRDPEHIDALQMRIQILSARGDAAGALSVADRAVVVAPWSSAVRLDRAAQALAAGQDAKAREDVEFVVSNFPRLAAGQYLNAMLLARAGRFADASTALDALRPVIEQFPRALYLQALISARLGNMETALDFATRFNRRFPADPDGIRLLARTRMAANQPGPAIPLLQRAVAAGMDDAETLDILGGAYRAVGNRAAALEAFRRAASLRPGDAAIATHLGVAQLEFGDSAAGTGTLTQAAAMAPDQDAAPQALVEAALRSGEPDKAEALLDSLRARTGMTPAVAVLAGTIKLARSDYEGARAAFAGAVAAFPDSAVARMNLGKALILQGREPEGELRLHEALAMRPADMALLTAYLQYVMRDNGFPAALQALEAAQKAAPANELITAMLSDMLVRSGRPDRAAAMLSTKGNVTTLTPVLLGASGRAEAAAGRLPQALAAYDAQLRATPTDLEARRAQVELLLREDNGAAARRSLDDALARMPGTLSVLTAVVDMERRQSGVDAAITLARRLRDVPVHMPNAGLLEGNLWMEAKRWTEARDAFAAEYARAPTSPLAQRLALAQVGAGDAAAGGETLRDWMQNHPRDADAAQVLARLDVQAERFDDAAAQLETVLQERPDNIVALNNLALIYQMRGDSRARALAQRAYLEDPNEQTADTLGWILVQQGDAKAAVPVLQAEGAQRSTNPRYVYHLAVALEGAGERDQARTLLERLATLPDAFADKADAARLLSQLSSGK